MIDTFGDKKNAGKLLLLAFFPTSQGPRCLSIGDHTHSPNLASCSGYRLQGQCSFITLMNEDKNRTAMCSSWSFQSTGRPTFQGHCHGQHRVCLSIFQARKLGFQGKLSRWEKQEPILLLVLSALESTRCSSCVFSVLGHLPPSHLNTERTS